MNIISRTIAGTIIILFGLWFAFFIGFIDGPKIDFVAIIVGVLFLIFGIFILFNKKEDEIEKIKSRRGGKK